MYPKAAPSSRPLSYGKILPRAIDKEVVERNPEADL
jgi:hypothetical protein